MFLVLSQNNQGGYGVVDKVQIKRFIHIPNTIELVGKITKIDDEWEVCKQRSIEALVYPCKHVNVIKFLAIHLETMKVYTLWWNRGTLWKMLDVNCMKCSHVMDNWLLLWEGGYDMEGWRKLVTFKQNHVKIISFKEKC